MSRDIGRPISRQAVGRTAFLGSLYDATRDEFCERTIVNDDIPAVAIRHLDENHGHSSYEFDSSVSKKLRKLNVDVSLSLSILGGLVKSAGASSNYLYTRDKTSHTLEATFIHRSITRTESLNASHKELKTRVEPTALRHKNATHVVTSIRWGADVFAQFEAKTTTAESKHVAKVGLKLELDNLLSKFVSINLNSSTAAPKDAVTSATTTTAAADPKTQNGTAVPQFSFESTSTATTFNYKITLFGDLIPTTCPKSIDEVITMLPSITTSLQKTNGGKGRPLEYIMLPISELAEILDQDLTIDRIFQAVEESTSYEIQTIFDETDQLKTAVYTLHVSTQKTEDFFHDEEMKQVTANYHTIGRTIRDIRSRIGKMLIRVRSGNAEPSELDQLLIEIDSQVVTQKAQVKELERGDISVKLKFALELKAKGVIAVREPETLSIIQNTHPKQQLIVLYTSNELRLSSKEKWITVYFEFLRRLEAHSAPNARFLYCYFDYDLNPSFQPQHKKLEIKEYVGAPIIIPTTRIRPDPLDRQQSAAGIDSLFKNVSNVAAEFVSQWYKDANTRFDEMFAKSGSRILVPYAPSLASRNEVFDKLRRNQKNILLIGRSRVGKSTFKNLIIDPAQVPDGLESYSKTEFPLFEQYSVSGTDIIMNFIDTPGLCQRTNSSSSLPDNTTIMQLIDGYVRSKVTQLHFVCFCVTIDTKINTDDLQIVRTFFNFLGNETRKNTCLIITNCESKSDEQREMMSKEAQTDLDFKVLASQMKQGIFFTGSINPVSWADTSNTVYKQFETICEYRTKLINLFTNIDVKPIDLTSNIIARKIKDELEFRGKGKLQ